MARAVIGNSRHDLPLIAILQATSKAHIFFREYPLTAI
jgi:hypothetical protein